jgi:UDP-N-acetylglucosamine transferase subunit ALG13
MACSGRKIQKSEIIGPYVMSTFVCLGNMKKPFYRLVDLVDQHSSYLPKPIVIQHGHTSIETINSTDITFFDFFDSTKFNECINKAQVCIGHAGAGFVLNCLINKKKPMLIARQKKYDEHVDDHQVEFSNYLFKENFSYEFSMESLMKYKGGEISLFNANASTGD